MKTKSRLILISLCLFLSAESFAQETAPDLRLLGQLTAGKRYGEVIALCKDYLRSDSTDTGVLFYLGSAFANLRQYEQAARAYEQSERLSPGNRSVILNLAECYAESARLQKAELLTAALVEQDSTDIAAQLLLAQLLQRQSRIEDAAAIYDRLWSQDSTNLWYPRQLGLLYLRNDRPKEGVACLEYVVEADSTDQESFLRLGQAYVSMKAPERIPVLDKAIRQDSANPFLRRFRGGLELMSGWPGKAEKDLRTALELGDSSLFTIRHLGISLFNQTKYAEAKPVFQLTVEKDSLDSEAWYFLGYCHKWTENLPEAIRCMNRALTIAVPPSASAIYCGLGLFHHLRSEFQLARTWYEKALECNPADPYPYSQLGVLTELTTRDLEEAKRCYEKFKQYYKGGDKSLIQYVDYRLQMVNEKLFMEGKLKPAK